MLNNDDKIVELLEKAVKKASSSIEKEMSFRPFLMTSDVNGVVKTIENRALSNEESYELLQDSIRGRVMESDIDIAILVTADMMPSKYIKDNIPVPAIRIHLEDKSQLDKKISARFIYVPYSLHRIKNSTDIFLKVGTPIPVGFPAEYLSKHS
ncbi:hypothetical protein MNB_SV-9-796 [hydrothermal vent metagenome]|uniref:Uncharacterized protein n=1 Tax=hydrothermal vent metagenome TaxID=652676 RepID=A0A1W1C2V0_9ZZZZ